MKKYLSYLILNLLFIGGIFAQPPCPYDNSNVVATVNMPAGDGIGTQGGLTAGEMVQFSGLIPGEDYIFTFCSENPVPGSGANAGSYNTGITVFEGFNDGTIVQAANDDAGCANGTAAEVIITNYMGSGDIEFLVTNTADEGVPPMSNPCSTTPVTGLNATVAFQCTSCMPAPTGPPCPYNNVPEPNNGTLSAPQDNAPNTLCCISSGQFFNMCGLVDGQQYTFSTCSAVITGSTPGSINSTITIYTAGGAMVVAASDDDDTSCGSGATCTFIWDSAMFGGGDCIDILMNDNDVVNGPCDTNHGGGLRATLGWQCDTCDPPPVDPPCPYDNEEPEVTLDIAQFNVSNRYSFLAPGESAEFCNLLVGETYIFTFCSDQIASADPGTFDTEISVYYPGGGPISAAIIGNEDDPTCTNATAATVMFTYNPPPMGPNTGCVEVLVDNNATAEGGSPCSNSCNLCLSGTLAYVCSTCPDPPVDESQNNDCIRAQTICINDQITWNAIGPGEDDFANPANQSGCLIDHETQSAWYYFEFDDQTAPGSTVEFTLDPIGGDGEDYDFAVWGPNVTCDNLGAPIRCSAASPDCGLCPATGVGMGATEPVEAPGCTAEGVGADPTCDGFVMAITVNPGEGYFLMIDNWLGSTLGFNLTFGGTILNNDIDCDAQAPCGVETDAGPDITACGGDTPMLDGSADVMGDPETYSWQGNVAGSDDFLSSTTVANPTVNIPADFSGVITYTLTVTSGECVNEDEMMLTVEAAGNPGEDGTATACTGGATINLIDFLGGTPDAGGTWSPALGGGDQGTFDPSSDAPGVYTYTVSPGGACPDASATVGVTIGGPTAMIAGMDSFCAGGSTDLTASGGDSYQWDDTGNSTTAMITVSMAGTYTVTVTDANMCTDTESITITETPAPSPSITGNTDICPGEDTMLDAGAFDSYMWSPNGETSQTITADAAGQYCVTVTDATGCTGENCITVNEFPEPMPNIMGTLEICEGGSTELDAGSFSSYEWTPGGETTQTIMATAAGQYCVNVTDANGCTGQTCVDVMETPGLTPMITGMLDICAGGSTDLDAGSYTSYMWSPNNETTQSITATAGGQYCVTVTDADGCTGEACATVTENPNPTAEIAGSTTYCTGTSTTLDAGAGFTYMWSPNNETSQTIVVSTAGQYCVTITDANGCTDETCVDVTESSSLMPNITGMLNFCEGGSTSLDAGAGFDTYMWSPGGENTQNITVSASGQYCVTVTDASGCSGEACVDVMQNANPTATIDGATSICSGGSTTLDATGAGLTYLWSPNGQTTPTITADMAGEYCVTVTNAEGCTDETCVTVTETTALMPDIAGDLDFCFGESTDLTADAGFETYSWTPGGATTPTITASSSGQYCVVVSDASGCTGQTCVTVTEGAELDPDITGDATICDGETTMLDGGIFDNYLWMPGGEMTPSIIVSTSGTYILQVMDANGCTATDEFTVTVNPSPTVTIAGSTTFCTGSVTNLDAGAGFASYSWSPNGQTTQSIVVGTAGEYCVTVTDDNGCTAETCVDVTESSSLEPVIGGPTSFCPGETIMLDGGAGFATYEWNTTPVQTTQMISVSAAGDYTLTVSDGSGCTGTATVTITAETEPMPMITGELTVCPGETTTLDAGAGFASYAWDFNGNINQTIMNVPAGTYCVTVTNAAGCEGMNCVTVTETAAPVVNISGATVIPPGGMTDLTADAGFASYSWSPNGETTETITANGPGEYCVTVTDANGCTGESCVTVEESMGVIVNISGDNNFCEGETVTLDAGPGFEIYAWGDGEDTQMITVDAAGTYSVTVTNADGNTGEDDIVVTQNATPMVTIMGDDSFCEGGTATLTASGGFASYLWDDPAGSTTPSITVDATGTYSVTVTSAEGCTGTASFTTTENPNPVVMISGSSTFCAGSSTILDAGSFASYIWSNNATSQTIEVMMGGTFSVTVTDGNGCTGTASIEVTEDSELSVNITGNDNYCEGGSTTLDAGGGNGFTYLWNTMPAQISQTINVSEPGDYIVTVTDPVGGCTGTGMITVTENPNPTPTITGNTSFCIGNSTTLDAGAGFTSYAWSNTSVNQTITVEDSGTFTVTVTDENGCTGMASITVEETDGLAIDITGDDNFCAGETATIDAGAGTGWTYLWSNDETTQTITVDMGGTYSVTVTDDTGCSGMDAFTVTQNPDAVATITGALSFCEGTSTTLSVDDLPGYTYAWMPNDEMTASITADEPGNYSVMVTSPEGCTAMDMVTVEETDGLAITVVGDDRFCNGASTVLDAGTGMGWTYEWNTTPVQTTQTITVDETNNYTVTVTDPSGCTGIGTLSVTEDPVLMVNIAGSTTYCVGSFTTLDAGTGNGWTYDWSNTETTQSIMVTTPGDYSVTITDENGCTATDMVTVNEDTELSPNVSGDPEYCEGSETILDAGAGFANYTWTDPMGGTTNTQTVTANMPGMYTLLVDDGNGCTGTETIDVIENANPTVEITGDDAICEGDVSVLSVDAGFDTYEWAGPVTSVTNTVNADQTGNYAVTATDENGCSATDDFDLQVAVIPTASAGMDNTIDCINTSVILDGSGSSTGAGITYEWTGDGIDMTNMNDQSPTVSVADTYVLTVTEDIAGCSDTDMVTIDQDGDLPVADAGADMEITCIEIAPTLDGSGSEQGPMITYTWSGGSINAGNMNQESPQVNQAAEYTLVVLNNDNGCSATDMVTVTENITEPESIIDVVVPLDCQNTSLVIDGTQSTAGANISYQWFDDNGAIPGATDPTYETSVTGNFTLLVTDMENGCFAEDVVFVDDITAFPIVEVSALGVFDCETEEVTLSSAGSQTGATIIYEWFENGTPIGTGETIIVDGVGPYTLSVTDTANMCQNEENITVETDMQTPIASAGDAGTLDCFDNPLALDGTGSSQGPEFSYLWTSPDGNPIDGTTSISPSVLDAGTYEILVTNTQNGCTAVDMVQVANNEEVPTEVVFEFEEPTCAGDKDGSIIVTEVTGGVGPFTFTVGTTPLQTGQSFTDLAAGDYNLIVAGPNGCTYEEVITLADGNEFQVTLGDDQRINLGESTDIEAMINPDVIQIVNVIWTASDSMICDNCFETVVTPISTTSYTVSVEDENGCIVSDDLVIFVDGNQEIYVPNVFSPNGDGENDILMIFANDNVQTVNNMAIYTRWGTQVFGATDFSPNDPNSGFDGTFEGKLLNPQVLVWKAEVTFINGETKVFMGDVTLIN